MKKVDVILGLQWGDEGKGKVVDVLTPAYEVVARFQGGPNAGHTLEFNGEKYVLRSIPSGIFQGGKTNIIGNGVVLDPILFREEATALTKSGHDLKGRLQISKKAHLILPTHRMLDAAQEAAKGSARIGTTGKGIGPTYTDKVSRTGMRVGDVLGPEFRAVYDRVKARHEATLRSLGYVYDIAELERQWFDAVEYLKEFRLIDSEYEINRLLAEGQPVLAEGAQGTLLDIDHGTYPYVTSSNTTAGGVATGSGLGPRYVDYVLGIIKAYSTRVGAGPFPTELFDETGEFLCKQGNEFGATTGRRRRTGWLDAVAVRRAVQINSLSGFCLTKLDVLDGLKEVKICVGYRMPDGREVTTTPLAADNWEGIEPIYETMPGWSETTFGVKERSGLPQAALNYIARIEELTGVPVDIISTGPDRTETMILRDPFDA